MELLVAEGALLPSSGQMSAGLFECSTQERMSRWSAQTFCECIGIEKVFVLSLFFFVTINTKLPSCDVCYFRKISLFSPWKKVKVSVLSHHVLHLYPLHSYIYLLLQCMKKINLRVLIIVIKDIISYSRKDIPVNKRWIVWFLALTMKLSRMFQGSDLYQSIIGAFQEESQSRECFVW